MTHRINPTRLVKSGHLSDVRFGGPKVREPAYKGFGGRVIEQMIAQRLGKTHFDWRADDFVCEITLRFGRARDKLGPHSNSELALT